MNLPNKKSTYSFVFLSIVASCSPSETKDVSVYQVGSGEPLIVMLGGSEGGYPHISFLVDEFVASGMSVAEIAYFGLPDGPKYLSEISVDAVAAEIQALSAQHSCVGVLGISKGAELALILASYKNISDVTVATAPSSVVWQSSKTTIFSASSWVLDGDPMPYVPYRTFSWAALSAAWDVNSALDVHLNGLANTSAVGQAVIPVERIDQPVLLQAAAHDQVWPSLDMSQSILDRANHLNPNHEITLKSYDHDHYLLEDWDAVHDLTTFIKDEMAECAGSIEN